MSGTGRKPDGQYAPFANRATPGAARVDVRRAMLKLAEKMSSV